MTEMVSAKSILVYGNCQADAIAVVLRRMPLLNERFRIVYLRSFDHPLEGFGAVEPSEIESCDILLEQHDLRAFPYGDQLPAHCRRVTFPSVDLNVLWPFNRSNPYNDPETTEHPYGRFPYGDGVIIRCLDQEMFAEDILAYYLEQWEAYKPDLDRLFALDRARLEARDSQCDVKMGAFVLDMFTQGRLFWSVNHPTTLSLAELIARLLSSALPESAFETSGVAKLIEENFGHRGPLGVISVPVHPKVAKHFGISWYDQNELYPAFDGCAYTYEGYFRAMIETSAHRRELLQSA